MSVCVTPPAGTRAPQQTSFVVIVGSDVHLLFSLAMLLQRFNYRVCTGKSGEEALEMSAIAVPSLVITELDLPGMSGFDLFHRLRQDPRAASVPFIAVVGGGDAESGPRCVRAGFTASLQMPVAAEELYRAVQRAVEPRPRSSIRVPARMPVTVDGIPLNCDGGECASVLSEHGMYIRTLKPAVANTVVALQFMMNGRPVSAEAVVLYSHRFGEGPFGDAGMGLKFLRIQPTDQEEIRRYIRSEITQGITPPGSAES